MAGDVAVTDSSTLAFIESVRQATRKYRDVEAAITAGYRPIGPDMPNMGQHWIHTELARRRTINPGRPGMLTYLRVDSTAVLTGIAFTQPVLKGESPPYLPYQGASWHYHFRNLEAEALGLPHQFKSEEDFGARLAMFHIWAWVDNPDGIFAPDNWALPFVRAGIEPPEHIAPASAKALFLLDGGVDFYVSMVEREGGIGEEDLDLIRAQLETTKTRVAGIADRFVDNSDESMDQLSEAWLALQKDVERSLSEKSWRTVKEILQ